MNDLISRQDAIDALSIYGDKLTLDNVAERIYGLPSAQPERKKGEWIFKDHLWECNQCGCRINREHPLKGNIWNYNFCPNCGCYNGGKNEV